MQHGDSEAAPASTGDVAHPKAAVALWAQSRELGFPKIRGTFLVVPVMRIRVSLGFILGSLC